MTPALLVTDTHPLIWYGGRQFSKLPVKVRQAFDYAVDGRTVIFIPWVVMWEVSLAIKAGKVRAHISLDEYIREKFFAKAISILDMEPEDIIQAHALNFTSDPFDTMIVATALRINCPLITADRVIHEKSPCELFWD